MAQDDDDRFEPRLGRSRRDKIPTPTTLRSALMRRVTRAGVNPRRLPSALPRTPTPSPATSPGRFNARGRGAKIAATFPRGSGWSFDPGSGARVRARRVTVKVRIVKAQGKAGGVQAHLRYLEREGVSRDGEPGRLYSTFTDDADRDAFIDRGLEDRHQFRIILSPEDGAAYEDLKPFTRDVMAQMETDLGTTLDWVAVDHHDTGHPHVHVVIRGVTEDGKTLNIAGDYLSYGIRHRAGEVLTRDLGPQTEQEVQRQLEHEVEAERLTRLDRTLIGRAEDGVIDLRADDPGTDFERAHRQLLVARARQLERMQLATPEGPLRWSLSPNAEDVLRTMGERGDIIKAMHRAMTEAKLERSPHLYTIHDRNAPPIVGRVVGRGLGDEQGDRRYLVIDGIDGRSHYADIGEAEGSFSIGSVVRLSNRSTEPRRVDRTVAEIATANEGRYSIDIHLEHDRAASEAFAQAHVRRLEAIRRATGAVEREPDGTWTIAPDHLDRVREYEQRLLQVRPVVIETLSTLPIERQIGAEGATWLDRQLIREVNHERADHGFGRDVRQALVRRQQWLIEQGLMQRDGNDVLFRKDILTVLEQRELRQVGSQLAAQLGKTFVDPIPGIRVDGVYRQAVDLVSGRFALIEKSLEFTLVPWRPVLERHIGRAVSGIPHGDDFDWTIGRGRSGPSL
jgi:type IV secretory pathway VirD2 relaxase